MYIIVFFVEIEIHTFLILYLSLMKNYMLYLYITVPTNHIMHTNNLVLNISKISNQTIFMGCIESSCITFK